MKDPPPGVVMVFTLCRPAQRRSRVKHEKTASGPGAATPSVKPVAASQAAERSKPNRYASLGHQGLGLRDGVFTVVEDAGRQHRIGTALLHPVGQVV